jgi:hypothetical protein
VLRLNDLVDYDDEEEVPGSTSFDRQRRVLHIPTAPARRQHSIEDREAVEAVEDQSPEAEEHDDLHSAQAIDVVPTVGISDAVQGHIAAEVLPERVRDLRAAHAVLKVTQMPKTGRMGLVLPTMQPDQYRFVSWPCDRPLIVQGQPGTGKTVIAAHRAVYLTSVERESERVARIAIVGPSDTYVEHVTPIVSELKEPQAEIRILSLPAFLQSIVGLRTRPRPGSIGRIESSWEIGRVVEEFVRSMPARPTGPSMEGRVRQVTESLVRADATAVASREIRAWLRALPRWSELAGQARYLPMLASIALALNPRAGGDWVGHVIVDEAQDVRPVEWRILTGSLLERDGQVSLFGDMNQRRSDWTASNWHQIARDLGLTDDEGRSNVVELENGYRATRQILRFANQLLPRGARAERALSEGPEPRVLRVPVADRERAAVDNASDLAARHPGIIAVISVDPTAVSAEFRRRHWVRHQLQHGWTLGGRTVVVFHPDEARGLEFDGAVVVEPGDFQENVGRQGVLYTSLTRANKELVVVYSAALPKDLRVPRVD